MPGASPLTNPDAGPEPLKELHDELREIVVAIKQAKGAGNTELETELVARHRKLFQKCREEAKKLNEEAKSRVNPDAPRIPIPDTAEAIEIELKETAAVYNAAIQAADHTLATELRAKLNELREASAAAASASASGPHNTSLAIDGVRIWCEIHNMGPYWDLDNAGGWDVEDGWFENWPAGDYVPGDVCYIHTGGSVFKGIDVKSYWRWEDGRGESPACRWWAYLDSTLLLNFDADEWGDQCYHTWDSLSAIGKTVRFYFTHP